MAAVWGSDEPEPGPSHRRVGWRATVHFWRQRRALQGHEPSVSRCCFKFKLRFQKGLCEIARDRHEMGMKARKNE